MSLPVAAGIIAACFIAGAVIFQMYETYYATQTDSIDLGYGESLLLLDGEGVYVENPVIEPDIFSGDPPILDAGETESFTHTLQSFNGDFDFVIDSSSVTFTDPEDPYYGYTFAADPVSGWIPSTHEIIEITFTHSLDENFMQVEDPLPFYIELDIIPHVNLAPEAVEDTYYMTGLTDVGGVEYVGNWDVLVNDLGPEADDELTLVSVTSVDIAGTLTVLNGMVHYHAYSISGDSGMLHSATYIVEDSEGLQDTGTLYLDLT